MKLGQILVRKKKISKDRLEKEIAILAQQNKRLGELLVEKDIISSDELEDALREQGIRQNGMWVIGN